MMTTREFYPGNGECVLKAVVVLRLDVPGWPISRRCGDRTTLFISYHHANQVEGRSE